MGNWGIDSTYLHHIFFNIQIFNYLEIENPTVE
jgi:hypothetical protein